jgi:hypothetical protein
MGKSPVCFGAFRRPLKFDFNLELFWIGICSVESGVEFFRMMICWFVDWRFAEFLIGICEWKGVNFGLLEIRFSWMGMCLWLEWCKCKNYLFVELNFSSLATFFY